jgi:glycosyltransferase involved in cell wall biosynthesis
MPTTEPLRRSLVEDRVRSLAAAAAGPVLHIADGPDPTLAVVAGAVSEAGRRVPVVACSRGAVAMGDEGPIVWLAGDPAEEVRALRMRFAAAVIVAESRATVVEELEALEEGKLWPGASVLVLGAGAEEHGTLELRERFDGGALLGAAERPARHPGERRPPRSADPEHARRRRHDLGAARRQLLATQQAVERRERDLEVLGERLTERERAELALTAEVARLRDALRGEAHGSGARVPEAATTVTVIVPVQEPHDALARCLDSVLAHTPEPHQVLLVDDGSRDPRIGELLERHARSPRVTVLSNPARGGVTAAFARGCDWAPGDVVLLDADCEVGAGWLESLRSVARSRRDLATVAPVTDRELSAAGGVAATAALVARVSERHRPPWTAHRARCLYVRREALDRLGRYDGDAFQRRARESGLATVLDDATYVSRVAPVRRRGSGDDDGLAPLRAAVAAARRAGAADRPTVLFVLHAGAGGTPQTNRDLARSLSASFRCLTLACDLERWSLTEARDGEEIELEQMTFDRPWQLREPLDRERSSALRALVTREDVGLLHVRSFIASGPELVEVAKALDVPVVCSLHDFYTACPTIHLLDEHERFCAGRCTPGPGPCPTSKRWVGEQPDLKHGYVRAWQARMGEQLARADAFVTTSEAARDVLTGVFPFMPDGRLRLIEHGRDAARFRPVGVPPGERPRVVAFGALGRANGISLLQALLELDREQGPHFEFHFLGPHDRRLAPETLGAVDHGPYGRDELPDRLAAIGPSYALVTSIWPETYCHTLTEAWMSDLPVFASDIGTLRERVGRHGGGWLLDHTEPGAFYAGMRAVAGDVAEWQLRRAEIAAAPARTVDDMAADYRSLYRELLAARTAA